MGSGLSDDVSHILVGRGTVVVPVRWWEDLRCVFLRALTRGPFRVLGVNPFQGSTALDSWMGTDHGIFPWDITLVMRKFDGGSAGSFFVGRSALSNNPIFYVTCYILSSGGSTVSCFKTIGNGVPQTSMPWADTCVLKFRHLTTSSSL